MKNRLTKTAALTAMIMAALLLTGASNLNAAEKEKTSFTKNAIGNLKAGITSDNLGLRRSAVYYAGEYKVSEVLPELNAQLKKETDNSTKILLALVIYRMGDSEGISTVKKLAVKDSNPEVRRMCASIYTAFVNEIAEEVASVNR